MADRGPIRRFLAADHHRLEALLDSAVKPSMEIDPEPYEEFRAGLLRHIGIEEKVLFPISRRANDGRPHPSERRLHLDHGALALLLVPTPTAGIVGAIRSILEPHDATEEGAGGIYDACDLLLGDELDAVMDALRAFPPVKVAPHFDGAGVSRTAEEALRAVSRGKVTRILAPTEDVPD